MPSARDAAMPETLALSHSREGSECELTILMPCLNEAETIGVCVRKALEYIRSRGLAGEVVIADNGSTDGSRKIAEELGARIVAIGRKGYGSALLGGIEAARGRYVIMGDADDSYDFSDLDPFVEKLRAGYQLVMGNRFAGGIEPGAMPPLHRYLGNPVLTMVGRLFFAAPIRDFHCGLRGFDRTAIRRLDLTTLGMEFASEMVVKSTLRRIKMTEVPTVLRRDGRSRPPHLRSWRDGWRHLRFLLLFSPRWLFFYPGIALMVAGGLSMLWLMPQKRTIGNVSFDVNTMVFSAAAIICGFQAAVFAVFATVFAVNARLLPFSPKIAGFTRLITLEIGVTIGLLLLIGGLAVTALSVDIWSSSGFGPLDPSVLRIVIPAATALMLGLQVIFSSFFLSILELQKK
jgi:glycosyltransferase involved in cell wall biosynthesis